MRRIFPFALLLSCVFFTGCPRYDTVRKLSTEQLRVQADFQSTMTKYFASMEQFADNQINVDKMYYDDLLDQDIGNRQKRFDAAIEAIKNDATKTPDQKAEEIKTKALEFGQAMQIKRSQNDQDKSELDDLLQQYKSKNKEILATYQSILEAQTELDRYIQLKKFDEVITEQLLSKMRVNQQKLVNLFDQTANIAGRLKFKQPATGSTAATQ
jgi:flagellar motility protein MotE (MotC chaperone)